MGSAPSYDGQVPEIHLEPDDDATGLASAL
jgi:hypothetical protein